MGFKQDETTKKWYFENEDGTKACSKWVQNENKKWYYLDKDGSIVTGWFQTATDGDNWFYAYKEQTEKDNDTHYVGEIATGWIELENKWFYLYLTHISEGNGVEHAVGEMAKGWIELENKWYYAIKEAKGLEYNGDTHYGGECVIGATVTIDSKSYTFDDKGVMQVTSTTGDSLVSDDCIDFVKGYEAFFSYKYDDGTGVITQGYGCIGDEIADWGDTITEQQASDRLNELINANYAKPIKADLDAKGVTLTQSQQDALYSMSYNIGVSSLLGSSLYSYITSGGTDSDIIKTDFCKWNRAGGNVMAGLTARRVAEANMYNNGVYDSTH